MSEEWSDWFEHDGKGCPCVGQYAHWVFDRPSQGDSNPHCQLIEGGRECIGRPAGGLSWYWQAPYVRVLRYRIRKPRALIELIDMVENLPAPVGPKVDA